MADKVITAIFGNDLRTEIKKHELSKSGNKINIVPEGAGYFMPEIGPTTFLDLPSWKRYFLFGARTYKRVYFAKKKASKCVDFGTDEGIIYGPDEEQIKAAEGNFLAGRIGQDANKGTPWFAWVLLATNILLLLVVLRVI